MIQLEHFQASMKTKEREGPSSFQWCPVTGQGATGTNWGRGSSSWTRGRTSSLWGWRSPGPGCPGRLWSLLLWRYSRPTWTRSCAACSGWPCFGRRAGLGDPQRSLPTPTILWFCDHGEDGETPMEAHHRGVVAAGGGVRNPSGLGNTSPGAVLRN